VARRRSRRDDELVVGFLFILYLIILILALIYLVITSTIAWISENLLLVILIGIPLMLIVAIVVGVGGYYFLKRRNERSEQLYYQVVDAIKEFKPSKKWSHEEGYHAELQRELKNHFKNAMVEIQKGSSRPDIVIDDIAIEVKGPTGASELETIPNKVMRYGLHFRKALIIVLFDLRASDRYYKEWLEALKRQFPEVEVIKK